MNFLFYIAIASLATVLFVAWLNITIKKIKNNRLLRKKEKAELEKKIKEVISQVKEILQEKQNYLNNLLLHPDHYFTYSECEKFKEDTEELCKNLIFLKINEALIQLGENAENFLDAKKNIETIRYNHNKEFISKELEA